MPCRSWWRISAFVLAIVAAASVADAAPATDARPRIRLVYETEANPPHALGDGTAIDRERPGLTLELLGLVAKRAGVEFVYERVPWRRGLYLLETNEVDGLFHISFTPERQSIMAYPMKGGRPDAERALFQQNYLFYKRPGSPLDWDGKALRGTEGPVGATSGYSVIGDLTRLGIVVEEAKTLEQSLDKLVGGRIIAYAGLEGMTEAVMAAHPLKYGKLVRLERPIIAKPYHLVFSRGFYAASRDLAERIWDAVAEVKASPEFTAAVRRYEE